MSACTIPSNLILRILVFLLGASFFSSCVTQNRSFDPEIAFFPTVKTLEALPSAFPDLSSAEVEASWATELQLGLKFARELDLYRAITCYKRALFLEPGSHRAEIEYHIVEAYFLGRKFQEAIEFYEFSSLPLISASFLPLKELLLILYESYLETGQTAKALRFLCLLQTLDPTLAANLKLYQAAYDANFSELYSLNTPEVSSFLSVYSVNSKSENTARTLNALLPGAGYLYVGQKKSAITSFVINALFCYAAYQFFDHGFIAAGLITTSLELGWYFGGINGSGLAAREWNECLYGAQAKEFLSRNRLFPMLMFSYVF